MIGPVAVLGRFDGDRRDVIRNAAGDEFDLRFPASSDAGTLERLVADAAYIVVHSLSLTEELLDAARQVRFVHRWGTGIDSFPIDALTRRGIGAARTFGANAPTVADLTLALMLATLRRIPVAQSALRDGRWTPSELWSSAHDLSHSRVALVGFGQIGHLVAQRLLGFDCEVMCVTRSGASPDPALARPVTLSQALRQADIVSLHLPLTDESRDLIGAKELQTMRPGSVLINTSRGGIVDEAALCAALASGQIGGAGLDVFAREPADPSNPLLAMDNVVAVPHIGGVTHENMVRLVRHWADNIRRFHNGDAVPDADVITCDAAASPAR